MGLWAFVIIALARLLAAISPGPAFVLSVRTAVSEGFRPAAVLALGWEKAVILLNVLWVETAWYLVVARAFSLPRA